MLIPALLTVCLVAAPTQCQIQTVKIQSAACGSSYNGQVVQNGQWVDVIFQVKCKNR